jgi:N-acetylglucosaminyl-diphospho-decaprenol L-rhamnosyltransferase
MPIGSVIVVSHNSAKCLEACLQSVSSAPEWTVILVDNDSTDSSVEIGRRIGPKIKILCNRQNIGFAGAVNQGIQAAETDICVILNPDVIPSPGALDKLAQVLMSETAGAVAGQLTRGGFPEIGFTVRRFPMLSSVCCEVLLINRLWPGNPWNRQYRCLDLDYSQRQEVEQPAGACLAIKRKAWEKLAGFDEDFFPVWFEDVDFCRRLRNGGWKILYCPDAIFSHSGGHSVNRLPLRDRQIYWYGNLVRYFYKHHSIVQVSCLRAAIFGGTLLRAMLSLLGLHPRGTSVKDAVSAYCQAAWRCGLRGPKQCQTKPTVVRSVS